MGFRSAAYSALQLAVLVTVLLLAIVGAADGGVGIEVGIGVDVDAGLRVAVGEVDGADTSGAGEGVDDVAVASARMRLLLLLRLRAGRSRRTSELASGRDGPMRDGVDDGNDSGSGFGQNETKRASAAGDDVDEVGTSRAGVDIDDDEMVCERMRLLQLHALVTRLAEGAAGRRVGVLLDTEDGFRLAGGGGTAGRNETRCTHASAEEEVVGTPERGDRL